MIHTLKKLILPVTTAREDYAKAYAARLDAERRGDTRRMHETGHALRAAMNERLRVEARR